MNKLDLALMLPSLWLAITLHEAAHAYAAYACGDGTAWWEGRLSLNPLRHVELVGTVLMPIALVLLVGVPFGWAKPVPVTFAFVKRYQAALIALAGPAANLAQALLWLAAGVMAMHWGGGFNMAQAMCTWGVVANLYLAGLNMLPLLPLDGGRVLHSLLPPRPAAWLVTLQPYSLWALLALVVAYNLVMSNYAGASRM
jgi:Zn-dependent protease